MAHAFSAVYLHLVFSTRDRTPFLRETTLREETHHYLGGIARTKDTQPLIVGGVEDHVHLLLHLGRSISISELVRELKRGSSRWIKEREPALGTFQWQSGYAAFSVPWQDREGVRRYIAAQEEHHRVQTFQEEYRQLLIEAGIEPDERFIWE